MCDILLRVGRFVGVRGSACLRLHNTEQTAQEEPRLPRCPPIHRRDKMPHRKTFLVHWALM